MKLVLASKNKKKIVEMQQILSQFGVQVLLQSDVGIDLDVEETGTTFEENSYLKAHAVMQACGYASIADDSGLCVDALDGAPGVYSARYGTEDLDDTGRYQLLLENMAGIENRRAQYVCVITCCFPNGETIRVRGECEGEITDAPAGQGGFGYDPIFYLPELDKTFAQTSPEQKHQISHRGKALAQFADAFSVYLKSNSEKKEE